MSSYCEAARSNPLLNYHHDQIHGFPCQNDHSLFEYYCLEVAQAGLSWQTIMKKHQGMRRAFDNFDIHIVANYSETDIARLMQEEDVIKYRLKIDAIIGNARAMIDIQKEYKSFSQWLEMQHGTLIKSIQENIQENIQANVQIPIIDFAKAYWIKLLKKHFRFVGKEIVGEFLTGIAYLPNAHDADCPIGKKIKQENSHLPYQDFAKILPKF